MFLYRESIFNQQNLKIMRKITFFAALFISILFAACQNSNLELAQVENLTDGEQVTPLRETFDFTYKGESYSSPFYMENDTLMILEDEKVATIYNKLQELPELATHVTSDGKIEYFDTYNDLFGNLPISSTRNFPNYMNRYILHIYEHSNYNRNRTGKIQSLDMPILIPDLDAYGMDDMISSCAVTNGQNMGTISSITFFRNPNYQAQSITFSYNFPLSDPTWGNYVFLLVENFHNYKVKKKINWNDRISSLKAY